MRLSRFIASIAILLIVGIASCTQLDQLSPQFAAKPEVPGHPATATQPAVATQPAMPADRVAQVASVAQKAAQNPLIVELAPQVPYGPAIIQSITILAGAVLAINQAIKRGQHEQRANTAETALAAQSGSGNTKA